MRVDKTNWQRILVSECTKVVKGKTAIQKKEYRDTGLYPIISQEKDFISGYCDNSENLNSIGEVIIFGDHTRVLKYIDFDFCIGADGVKILQPYSFLNAKYLYHFLRWIDIPSNGYSRHFKFLKETIVKYPPLAEQKGIAAELDAVQTMIDGYREQLADLDALAQSIFLDTFGDPITNPKNWEVKKISEVTSSNVKRVKVVKVKGKVWSLNLDKIESNSGTILSYDYVSLEDIGPSTFPFDNSMVLYSKLRPYLNKVVAPTHTGYATTELVPFIPKSEIEKIYFLYLLRSKSMVRNLNASSGGARMPRTKMDVMRNTLIPIPPLSLQQQFAVQVEAIEKQKKLLRQQIADAETLMAERMQYYFS